MSAIGFIYLGKLPRYKLARPELALCKASLHFVPVPRVDVSQSGYPLRMSHYMIHIPILPIGSLLLKEGREGMPRHQ